MFENVTEVERQFRSEFRQDFSTRFIAVRIRDRFNGDVQNIHKHVFERPRPLSKLKETVVVEILVETYCENST